MNKEKLDLKIFDTNKKNTTKMKSFTQEEMREAALEYKEFSLKTLQMLPKSQVSSYGEIPFAIRKRIWMYGGVGLIFMILPTMLLFTRTLRIEFLLLFMIIGGIQLFTAWRYYQSARTMSYISINGNVIHITPYKRKLEFIPKRNILKQENDYSSYTALLLQIEVEEGEVISFILNDVNSPIQYGMQVTIFVSEDTPLIETEFGLTISDLLGIQYGNDDVSMSDK